MNSFSRLRDDLSWHRSIALQMLKTQYSDEQIKSFVNRLLIDDGLDWSTLRDEMSSKGLTEWGFASVMAIFNIEVLQDFLSDRDEVYEPDDVCRAVSLALVAGMSTHAAGVFPAVRYADRFRLSCKLPRQDALGRLLEEIFKEYVSCHDKKPQYMHVIRQLEKLSKAGNAVVQEIDTGEEIIFWRRDSGNEETTSFKQLRERLTAIRKKNLA